MKLTACGAFRPRIFSHRMLRLLETFDERAAAFVIIHDRSADFFEADALDPLPYALQIGALLPIELRDRGHVFDSFFFGRDTRAYTDMGKVTGALTKVAKDRQAAKLRRQRRVTASQAATAMVFAAMAGFAWAQRSEAQRRLNQAVGVAEAGNSTVYRKPANIGEAAASRKEPLGEVRKLLREKIGEHAIEFDGGPGLHLGERDTRESV